MSICPTCLTKYPNDATTCEKDGVALVPEETFAAVDTDLAPGDVVGEYKISAKIGEGGFGAVYRAEHPVIGKMAAVKVLGRQFSSNAAMVSRFIAEARAVNQIRHRNIIDIFAFGALPDGRQYYVMELLDGMPFDQYIDRRGRLPLAEALSILRGVVRALDAAHDKGILHRDLKPENVFLAFDEDGRIEPRLLDFGLVKLVGDPSGGHRTKTGTPMGTPSYMSPEQCRGLEVDRRTDVYAFGAMLFEVLTGELPFAGQSAMDVIVRHMTDPPPSASERCAEVPHEVSAVIQRMMAKTPEERPSSLGEAFDRLTEAASKAGIAIDAGSVRGPVVPAAEQSRRELATGATLPAHAATAPAPVQVVSGGAAQTFLGAEADVAPAKPQRRWRWMIPVAGASVGAALAVGFGVLGLGRRTPEPPAATVVAKAATPPPAASASADPSASASAAARRTVEVRVEGAPDGAVVLAGGKELGVAPGPFEIESGVETTLTVSAKGHVSKEIEIAPKSDVIVPITLDKAPAGNKAAGSTKKRRPGSDKKHDDLPSDLESFDSK